MSNVSDCFHQLLMEDALSGYFCLGLRIDAPRFRGPRNAEHGLSLGGVVVNAERVLMEPRFLLRKRTPTRCLRSQRRPLSDSSMTDNWRLCSRPVGETEGQCNFAHVYLDNVEIISLHAGFVKDVLAACTTHFDRKPLILHETAV